MTVTDLGLKYAALDFLKLAAAGDVDEAFERHVAANFRHHNPAFRGDAAALKQAMQANARDNPDKCLEVQRSLQDGNEVVVFSRVRQRPDDRGAAVIHLFRFEDGMITELWDVGQAVPEESVNEHGMF
ncbi:nuclear transport factor 2 family protein [Agrilutibacter solisilvae]|uniref:Nuclear transport factor 2 family protein n=1 Tax=Agrilutibacter solisilvae TaxID=2763317 RepID=A0A974XZT8_9GAMM|nr:nuclear transport factor 2 family protein [Lysobacter solisilvae]QSX77958.1 nuclear transport factor 2 family protein [Lysobacter solisilvae]